MKDETNNNKTQHNATNHKTKLFKMTNKHINDKYLRPKAQILTHKRTRLHSEFASEAEIKNVLRFATLRN